MHLRAFRAFLVIVWIQYFLLLVSSIKCLEIRANLSISWTTPCCMVLPSSCCLLSSLFFLSWHILSICCHYAWHVGICSSIMFTLLELSWAWYFILWLIHLILFSTRCLSFSLQKCERLVFTFIHFLEICLDHLIIFLYGARVESELRIFCYRLSIDLVIVFFFTPHSLSRSLIEFI